MKRFFSHYVCPPLFISMLSFLMIFEWPASEMGADGSVQAAGTVADWYSSGKSGDEVPDIESGELPSSIRSPGQPSTSNVPNWWSLLTSFVTVLALIVMLSYLVRRFGLTGRLWKEQRLDVKVLYVIPLGGKRSIQVVQIGALIYVLGIGETINVLDRLTMEEAHNLFVKEPEVQDRADREERSFAEELEHYETRFKEKLSALQAFLSHGQNPSSTDKKTKED